MEKQELEKLVTSITDRVVNPKNGLMQYGCRNYILEEMNKLRVLLNLPEVEFFTIG